MNTSEAPSPSRVKVPAPRRGRLVKRFMRWPLVRVILGSRVLSLLFLLGILAAIGGPLVVLRLWTVSPPDMKPPIRISLLDRVQAWSLRRNALAAESRGDFDNARSSWRSAVANNAADVENIRSALRVIPRGSDPEESGTLALRLGQQLVVLGQTNTTDLELIATTLNRCRLYERASALLAQYPQARSASLSRLRLVTLIRGDDPDAVSRLVSGDPALAEDVKGVLQSADTSGGQPRDTDFEAVSLAYLAGWGPAETRDAAMEGLRQMAERSGLNRLAYEMQMMVYVQRRDLNGCEQVLRQLQDSGLVNLWHQTSYWQLLGREGRKTEAVSLARDANPVPKTDGEVIRLLNTFSRLGMIEEADQLCVRYLGDPPWLEQSALIRAGFLIQLERWTELRQLAIRLRTYPMIMEALGGASAFFEGLAEWHEGYKENAERAFEEAARQGFRNPAIALDVAQHLIRLGAIRFAEPILLATNVREALADQPAYLLALLKCAYYLRRSDYLGEAAEGLYRLSPEDPMTANNYAATLLILRTNVQQALSQTLRLVEVFQNSPEARLNHATALVLNGRIEDADAVLGDVSPGLFQQDSERTQYYLLLFELRLRQGRKDAAQAALRQLNTAELFPVQIEWLERTGIPDLETLPEVPAGTSAPEAVPALPPPVTLPPTN